METTCPAGPFVPPSCSDITRAASADATLAGLLATAASVFLVLILQERKKRSPAEQESRKAVLALLVSTFFTTLLASFSFGLLTQEPVSIRANALVNVAALNLVVGALQFLSSIGWLLALYKEKGTPLKIARWTLHLVVGLSIVYMLLDCADSLKEKTNEALPSYVYYVTSLLPAALAIIVIITIAWARTNWLKRSASPDVSESRTKEAGYTLIYAMSGPFIAAGCTLLVGIISEIPFTDQQNNLQNDLQNYPDWVFSLGVALLMAALGWVVYFSEKSWPSQTPAASELSTGSQMNHLEPPSDHQVAREATPPPSKEPAAPSATRRPRKKPADPV
ncbi:MAG TPA: hypothetical protein VFV38_04160 [Ktedonobacteraceae bacterium]|nr:hypothetical protein [Ktedonobacteraceae bacterium]